MEDFQACVDHCALLDSPATGSFYTWNNKQEPSTRVYSRLDRVLVNQEWLQVRPDAYANFFNDGYFDHSPCIIQDSTTSFAGRKSFKFFNMWSKVPEFLPCVQHIWNTKWQGTKMFQVVMKLKSLKQPLKNLNKHLFPDIENSTTHAWKVLDAIQTALHMNPIDSVLIDQEREALKTYRDLQTACDSFLLQKSKATWVNLGENNTKYFHSVLKNRHVQSKIFRITDAEGHTHTDGDKIQQAFLSYYHHLLGTTATTSPVSVPVVQLGKVCTPEHWDILLHPVSKSEVKNAIFSIPNHKAPGPDGFSSAFFKDSWSVIGDEVDLKNTYDSVNWSFLEQMLEALHFPPPFIHLVMTCVRTASYSLVFNGMNFGYFKGAKGDTHSIMILLRAFATFSIATGLQMNSMKSNIYFNGVHHSNKADIIEVSGFVEVLTSLYSYWATIFIIPKGVLRRIDALCRNYLWDSSTEFLSSPPVRWEKLSVPKCEGGLGVRNSYYWNATAIGKLVWWIHSKPDALRVRWVNHIYMKGIPLSSYYPKPDVAWSWKSICKLKNRFPLVFQCWCVEY
ncbi:uncharacterized protein LOC141649204 [Silene latifolia]|uniref:uncharacterized protein LOC141649204 n=1 Tax=Silene latifolia TaxID=37657 RepID=UPI003D78B02B